MLALMGPNSRALLEALSNEDLSNQAFPFGTSREIEIGYAVVRASRLTFVGELGWEICVPADFATHVFDRIVEAGQQYGLAHGGYFAINSLRMEKGYRHWGHDIGIEDTPIEAGLGFAVAYDKPGGFIGRDALLRQKDAGSPAKRLVQFALTDPDAPLLYHEEPIWHGDRIVGSITSGAYGHRVGRSLGMGYVHREDGVGSDYLASAPFEIEIATERFEAEARFQAFYDPSNERVRGDATGGDGVDQ